MTNKRHAQTPLSSEPHQHLAEEVFEPDSSEQVNNEQIQWQENNPTINEQVGRLKLGTPVL